MGNGKCSFSENSIMSKNVNSGANQLCSKTQLYHVLAVRPQMEVWTSLSYVSLNCSMGWWWWGFSLSGCRGMDRGQGPGTCSVLGGGGCFCAAALIVRKTVLFSSGCWTPAPPCLKSPPLSADHGPPQPPTPSSQLILFYKFKSDLVPPQFQNLSGPHGSWLPPLNSFFPSAPHSLGTNLPGSLPPGAGCSPPGSWHGWLHPTLHHSTYKPDTFNPCIWKDTP